MPLHEGLGAELEPAVRAELAGRWADAALAEHASIASFARFSLHLLAVGAPPTMVQAAHRAALDEVEHARLCFGIASSLHGSPLAPGPLDLTGDVIGPTDLASVVRAAVIEGCVGETLAALEARYAAQAAKPAVIREALEKIAADEQRHAELAWQFVGWAVRTGGAPIRQVVAATLARFTAPILAPIDGNVSIYAQYGRLDESERQRVEAEGLRDVVGPTGAELMRELG